MLCVICVLFMLLHRAQGLQFRGELDDEDDVTRNWLVRDIGNVTSQTEVTLAFEWSFSTHRAPMLHHHAHFAIYARRPVFRMASAPWMSWT